ncbi:MarR family winged helix-turn-helix transcriptional regulator [Nonomuraea harbinensis]|uniref:MarR family winged helix-turn-helix transcriptional regulator n=1 Tax=Nonomuraea harbinensis TaxID=1286938 RepID=A0ABW1BKJ3_9ACTN|nr:winged helix-turn-helix domain-containing protein [Nonomuraea harbinensis]
MNGYSELRLGPLDEVRATVALHPGVSLLSLAAGSVGGRPHGVPGHWRRGVAGVIGEDAAALRPLFDPYCSIIPDCLTATATMVEGDVETYLEMLEDLGPATLIRLWEDFAPTWHRAGGLLGKERERVGVAAVTGALEAVLTGLNSRFRFGGTSIRLPDQQGRRFDLGGRKLTFVPVVSGHGACLFSFDRPGLAWIGYPVPAVGLLWSGHEAESDEKDSLALTVGRVRATILRAGRVPLTMGELAGLLSCTPATASYHCDQLQAAGLLERERHGRHVRIGLTSRGEALVDLMS